MSSGEFNVRELHWLMDMLQTIDVGLVVIDRDYKVQLWNSFMQNHSGRSPTADGMRRLVGAVRLTSEFHVPNFLVDLVAAHLVGDAGRQLREALRDGA